MSTENCALGTHLCIEGFGPFRGRVAGWAVQIPECFSAVEKEDMRCPGGKRFQPLSEETPSSKPGPFPAEEPCQKYDVRESLSLATRIIDHGRYAAGKAHSTYRSSPFSASEGNDFLSSLFLLHHKSSVKWKIVLSFGQYFFFKDLCDCFQTLGHCFSF
ncbi:hypothetical protein TNIN_151271 [Trichonephila inaurata madagascariensis]|uniref:Uncharacterized protein n=1 Tax=Trichonephila inaurata madagascariensis TaxID=2747483 RepID=A0A8X6XAD6_9ARAC|nr:hypothetical protein TNIN_151271 [Trichonephila inaurata madagascariensis]